MSSLADQAPHPRPLKSRRRLIDAAGLAASHLALVGLVAWADRSLGPTVLLLAVPVLALDVVYYLFPPKRKPRLDSEADIGAPDRRSEAGSFTIDYLILLAPPALLVACALFLVWSHRILTKGELLWIVLGMPVVVGLVSWLYYLRSTRCHGKVRNQTTGFLAVAMVATWIISTFVFVVLLVLLLVNSFVAAEWPRDSEPGQRESPEHAPE